LECRNIHDGLGSDENGLSLLKVYHHSSFFLSGKALYFLRARLIEETKKAPVGSRTGRGFRLNQAY
jgi:hypothetical protein